MGLGWLGGLAGGLFSASSAKSSARAQMAFQERMAKNAHQYEVADLRAAGLNPILSATGGNGAAVPSGAGYSFDNPAKNVTADYVTAKRFREVEKPLADADIGVKASTTAKNQSDITVNDANKVAIAENVNVAKSTQSVNSAIAAKTQADTAKSLVEAKLISAQIPYTHSKAAVNWKTIDSLDAGIKLSLANAALAGTSSALNLANVERAGAETANIRQDTKNRGLDYYMKKNKSDFEKDSSIAPYIPAVERIMDAVTPFRFFTK